MTETILITGAGTRIGRHLALGLGRDGHRIAAHFRTSGEGADGVVKAIRDSDGTATAVQADLTDETAVESLIDRAAETLGPVTTVINNASVFEHDEALTATKESWDRHMAVNLRAPFVLSQSLARQLPDSLDGQIINMIDHRVLKLNPLFTSYTLSKSSLWTLTRTLAQALAPHIRVNAIGPGPVLPSIHQSRETFDQQAAAVPLGHGPELDEILRAVVFLLESPSVTGQMIALDGGQHLAWQTPDLKSEMD